MIGWLGSVLIPKPLMHNTLIEPTLNHGVRGLIELEQDEDLALLDAMAWAKPDYQRDEVNAAAATVINLGNFTENVRGVIASADDISEHMTLYFRALAIVNNWRASHNFPLNTMQNGLRRSAKQINANCLVAQRIKRLFSIENKLRLIPTLKLTQMQDIGGCRAIMDAVGDVRQLVDIYKKSDIKHKLIGIDDYITSPRNTGYRSVHLKYKYFSDRSVIYNNLKIEIQIRTKLQHAWATAVETVGTFTQQALKSRQGSKNWLRFFELMGTAMAIRENSPAVPNTPQELAGLRNELKHHIETLQVFTHLRAYGVVTNAIESQPDASHYYVLELDADKRTISYRGYKREQLDAATLDYQNAEIKCSKHEASDAVLVSVDSVASLKKAYPNYFADTHLFVNAVEIAAGFRS